MRNSVLLAGVLPNKARRGGCCEFKKNGIMRDVLEKRKEK
jgi:hypothetical protein